MSCPCPSYLATPVTIDSFDIAKVVRVMRQRRASHAYLKLDQFVASPFFSHLLQAVSTFSGVMYCMARHPQWLLDFLDLVDVLHHDANMRPCLFEPLPANRRSNGTFHDSSVYCIHCRGPTWYDSDGCVVQQLENVHGLVFPSSRPRIGAPIKSLDSSNDMDDAPPATATSSSSSSAKDSTTSSSPATPAFVQDGIRLEPFQRSLSSTRIIADGEVDITTRYACVKDDMTPATTLMEVAVRLVNPIMVAKLHGVTFGRSMSAVSNASFGSTSDEPDETDEEFEFLGRVRAKITKIDAPYRSLVAPTKKTKRVPHRFGDGLQTHVCCMLPTLLDVYEWTNYNIVPQSRTLFAFSYQCLMLEHPDEYELWFQFFSMLIAAEYPLIAFAQKWIFANQNFLRHQTPMLAEHLFSVPWAVERAAVERAGALSNSPAADKVVARTAGRIAAKATGELEKATALSTAPSFVPVHEIKYVDPMEVVMASSECVACV